MIKKYSPIYIKLEVQITPTLEWVVDTTTDMKSLVETMGRLTFLGERASKIALLRALLQEKEALYDRMANEWEEYETDPKWVERDLTVLDLFERRLIRPLRALMV